MYEPRKIVISPAAIEFLSAHYVDFLALAAHLERPVANALCLAIGAHMGFYIAPLPKEIEIRSN